MEQVQSQNQFLNKIYNSENKQPYFSKDVSFMTAKDLIHNIQSEKYLKGVESIVPTTVVGDKLVTIKDISLSKKGPEEDKFFAEQEQLHFNVRRGLTVIEEYDENKKVIKQNIARKGLHKFFDLGIEFLDFSELKQVPKKVKDLKDTSKLGQRLSSIILNPIRKVFEKSEQGDVVNIYKSEKANGENAQISYNKEYDSWVVSSKNVSMMVKNESDLNEYDQTLKRFDFSILIGKTWFQILKEKVPQDKIQELKDFMNGKTFVAEYCGNQDFQHLVKYTEIDLLFYAIVQNDLEMECLPLEQATQIFNYFNLTPCKFEKFSATNWDEFNYLTYQLFERVSNSSVAEEGEGAVLYFFSQKRNGEVVPLTLCKLKTLEYRIYRKLREKLKNQLIPRPKDQAKIFKKFQTETEELCKVFSPKEDLQYYYQVARKAFEYVCNTNNKVELNILQTKYISFLDMIIEATEKKIEIDRQFISDQLKKMPLKEEELQELQKEKIKPTQIVLVTPAFYLSDNIKQGILNQFGLPSFEENWHINNNIDRIKSIADVPLLAHSRISGDQSVRLEEHTYFVIVGFSEESYQQSLKKIEENENQVLKQKKDVVEDNEENQKKQKNKKSKKSKKQEKSNVTQSGIQAYLNANNPAKFLEDQNKRIKSIVSDLENLMPHNYEWIKNIDADLSEDKVLEILLQAIAKGFAAIQAEKKVEIQIAKQSSRKKKSSNEIEQKQEQQQQEEEQKKDDQELQFTEVPSNKNKNTSKSSKELVVFIPVTITATGKSSFLKSLMNQQDKDYNVRYISSDEQRQKLIKNYLKSHKNDTLNKAFDQTAKAAGQEWSKELVSILKETDKTEKDKNIIFLDKNHPINAIAKTVQTIKNQVPKHISVKIVAIVPECYTKFQTNKINFPYSAWYFLTCLNRALYRENHETMNGDTFEKGSIALMFMSFFKNSPLLNQNKFQLAKHELDDCIALPFHKEDESSDSKIPNQLKEFLGETLLQIDPRHIKTDQKVQLFITKFLEANIQFEEYDRDEQSKLIKQKIEDFLYQ